MKREFLWRSLIVVAFLTATAFLIVLIMQLEKTALVSGNVSAMRTVVIDPGHGGADGGAVGYSGSIEKDLNLDISLKLRDLLQACGYRVIMTRKDDRSIHDEDANTIRDQKRSDLYNRLEIYNENPTALVISIHLNHYGDPSCKGAQVYYSTNQDASKELAQSIQFSIITMLQQENKRDIKPAESNLFLLFHSEVPAVLCECGFVSNPEEEALLLDEEYRSKMAFAILTGLTNYLAA